MATQTTKLHLIFQQNDKIRGSTTAQQPKLRNYTVFFDVLMKLEGNHSNSNYQTTLDFRTV